MKYNEISHFSHPQHKLRYEFSEFPFKCDGCKEAGIGSRFKCTTCDFDLHQHCAIPTQFVHHPFYTKCSFQFMSRPPGNIPRYCNACERDVKGFVYHCRDCGFDLHPCCAKLPVVIHDGEVKLYLYRKVSASCHKCGRKGRSWSYRSTCKKYNLHVACVKDLLIENWPELCSNAHNNYYSKNNSNSYSMMMSSKNIYGSFEDGKVKRCCEVAGLAVQFIVAAVLGDPTALIAGVVGGLISKG
ncbi:hypothetical protein LINGRAHAP2_LOCUS26338 [Linum grandiflorum]